jgi:hypothetical protein
MMTDETCCGACGYPIHATKDKACDWCRQSADRIETLTSEVGELQGVFDFQWRANMRAVEMWRTSNPGNDLVLPDSAKLTVWLLERNETLTAKLAKAVEALRDAVDAWDNHNKTGDMMQGHWVTDARDMLAEIEGKKG